MSLTVGELNVQLGLDQSDFKSGIGDAEKTSKSFGSKLVSGFGAAGKAAGKAVAAGVAIGGAALVAFGKKAITVASDLEEVQNVVDTTFKESANQIESFADTAGMQFGLSELAAKQFASGIGSILTPTGLGTPAIADMSENLTGLSGDMASFFNVANEDAFGALRAGIIGETEPLKRFGIVMSAANLDAFALAEGMGKTTKQMTQAELATLRYNFIMNATKDVQGDFAKTSDSLANQQRIAALQVENLAKVFGGVLMPQASLAIKGVNALLSGNMEAFEGLASGLGEMLRGDPGGAFHFQQNAMKIIDSFITVIEDGLPTIIDILFQLVAVVIRTLAELIPSIIEILVGQIPALIEIIVGLIPIIVEAIVELVPILLDAGIAIIAALIDGIVKTIPVLIEAIPPILLAIIDAVIELLPIIVEGAVNIIIALVEGLLQAIPILVAALPEIIDSILTTIIDLLPVIIEGALAIIIALAEALVEFIPIVLEALPKIIESIVGAIVELLPMIVDAAVNIIIALVEGLLGNIPMLLDAIFSIGAVLIEAIIELVPALVTAGGDLIQGIIEGMKEVDLLGIIQNIGASIVGGFKSILGIESPSKELKKKVGKFMLPGIGEAIEEDVPNLLQRINRSMANVVDNINVDGMPGLAPAGAAGNLGGGSPIIFNINVELASGSRQEAEEAGRIIGETASTKLIEAARRRGRA